MFESVLQDGSLVGMLCIFYGIFSFGYLSGKTTTRLSESDNFHTEVFNEFNIDTQRHKFTFVANGLLGLISVFWLPTYVWIVGTFGAALVVFLGQLFAVALLSRLVSRKEFYPLWRVAPLITLLGFVLTVHSLL